MHGWEPAEVTTYEYEGDRLVRSVTVREPEYDADELALLLASRRRQGEIGSHGIPMSEAMDPANQFRFDAQSRPVIDWAAKAIADKQDAYYAGRPKGESRNGHRWGRVTYRDG